MNNAIFFEFSSVSLPILMLIATGYLARRLLVPWAALDRSLDALKLLAHSKYRNACINIFQCMP